MASMESATVASISPTGKIPANYDWWVFDHEDRVTVASTSQIPVRILSRKYLHVSIFFFVC